MDDFTAEMADETTYRSKLTPFDYVTFVSTNIRPLGRIFPIHGIAMCENVSGKARAYRIHFFLLFFASAFFAKTKKSASNRIVTSKLLSVVLNYAPG